MFKLWICVAIIVIFVSFAGCGTRYNWVPVADGPGTPNVEYEGTGIPDPEQK